MTVEFIKDLAAEVFKTVMLASGPVLLVSLLMGLLISFFQAITQIQEFTLTFVPKVIAVFVCLLFFIPWIASILVDFTTKLITNIPIYIR